MVITQEAKLIYNELQKYHFLVPEQSLSSIGVDSLKKALAKEQHEFILTYTTAAEVFKGSVAKFELLLAYGGK